MQPSTLLLTVDPSEDVREVIEQIQLYNDLINNEIKKLVFCSSFIKLFSV